MTLKNMSALIIKIFNHPHIILYDAGQHKIKIQINRIEAESETIGREYPDKNK
jgi:hypothetical protein